MKKTTTDKIIFQNFKPNNLSTLNNAFSQGEVLSILKTIQEIIL